MNQSILNQPRLDKFNLLLDIPLALKRNVDTVLGEDKNPNTIQFTVYGSPVPAIKIANINLPFGGQTYNTTSNTRAAYPPLDLKFILDNGYKNYWMLWSWLNLFNDAETGYTGMIERANPFSTDWKEPQLLTNPFSDYSTSFTLYALDEFNNHVISFKYTDVFITGLSELNFSHQDENIITSTATFVYNQLKVELLNNVNRISQ